MLRKNEDVIFQYQNQTKGIYTTDNENVKHIITIIIRFKMKEILDFNVP